MRKIIIPLLFTVLIPFSVSAKKAPAPTPVPMSQDGDTLLFDFGAEPEYGWVQAWSPAEAVEGKRENKIHKG